MAELETTLRKVKPIGESSVGRDTDGKPRRKSTYTPHEWPAGVPSEAFSVYEVIVKYRGKDRVLGVVCSGREEAEKNIKGSRLRHPNGVHRFWIAEAFWRPFGVGYRSDCRVGYHYWDRRDAISGLVREWERDGRPLPIREVGA